MDCHKCGEKIIEEPYNWRGHLVHPDCWESYRQQAIVDVRSLTGKHQIVPVGFKGKMDYMQIEAL